MSFPHPGTPRRSQRVLLIVGGVALVAALAAGAVALVLLNSRTSATTAAETPSPVAAPSSAAAAAAEPSRVVIIADPAALDACELVYAASQAPAENQDLYDPVKMRAAGQKAAGSANTEIKRRGDDLVTKADAAASATGKDAKFQANLAMGTAATDLATYCLQQKFVIP